MSKPGIIGVGRVGCACALAALDTSAETLRNALRRVERKAA